MKKVIVLSLILICGMSVNAQEIKTSKPIKTIYTTMLKDFEIKTSSEGDGYVLKFRDERYVELKEYKYIHFNSKNALMQFFNKLEEVQSNL